jgi:hypothetical protein
MLEKDVCHTPKKNPDILPPPPPNHKNSGSEYRTHPADCNYDLPSKVSQNAKKFTLSVITTGYRIKSDNSPISLLFQLTIEKACGKNY